MSRDVVIIVVPFLQQFHGHYGDYWRLSPLTLKALVEKNGLELLYLSVNHHLMSSVYIYALASKHPESWTSHFDSNFSYVEAAHRGPEPYVGCRAIPNFAHRFEQAARNLLKR
jgi:hypothetical protein